MMRRAAMVGAVGVSVLVASACGSSGSNPPAGSGGTESGGSDDGGEGGTRPATAGASVTGGASAGGASAGGASAGGASAGGTAGSSTGGGSGMGGNAGTGGGSDAGAGAGGMDGMGDGGEAGMPPIEDHWPPGLVELPSSGTFNLATRFACAAVSGIEAGASVYYEMTINGPDPTVPTAASSTKLGATPEVCGIDQTGRTRISILQVDAAGNVGPVNNYQYVMDGEPPVVCSVSTTPGPRAYRGFPLHVQLTSEPFGKASVDIAGLGKIELRDDGQGGDKSGHDGVYEADYQVPAGADIASAALTGHFSDGAGNAAPDFVGPKMFIDGTATSISGAYVADATWTAAASPYVVTGNAAFDADSKLTIEPGTAVLFKNGASLSLLGGFSAVGTVDAPIQMYGAKLMLYGAPDVLTYDPTTGAYVTGPRLDYVQMRDGHLVLGKQDPFGSTGAYITRSAIGTLGGESPFYFAHGVYIHHSWVGQVPSKTVLRYGRVLDSFFDSMSIDGTSFEAQLTYNQIGKLTVDRWLASFTLEHNNIGQMVSTRPTLSGPMAFHGNNLGSPLNALAFSVVDGAAAAPAVDATGNYWGATATAQMTSLGNKANISAIHDFYDNVALTKVEYKDFLTAPVTAGPNWQRSELVPEPDNACDPSSGGSSGGGGTGGTSGTSGSGGMGGSGGSSSGALIGACQNGSGYYCVEYSGPAQHEANLKANCQLTQQTWQATCSTGNLVGTCTAPYPALNGVSTVTRYYTGSPATPQQLKEACEVGANGTWSTP